MKVDNQLKTSSPSSLATTTEPQESLKTLTVVRNISSILSTAKITATHSSGNPTALRIIDIITIPAIGTLAAPIDANSAVITIINCCVNASSKPHTCAIKIAATHCYRAVPSMFTVAPIGRTNDAIFFYTFECSVTARIVNGSVTTEEHVENAVISADGIPL